MLQSTPSPNHAIQLRATAESLVQRLVADQRWLEQRMREQGRNDHFKQATGRSSIDNAIHSTQRLVNALDEIIQIKAALPRTASSQLRPNAHPHQVDTSIDAHIISHPSKHLSTSAFGT